MERSSELTVAHDGLHLLLTNKFEECEVFLADQQQHLGIENGKARIAVLAGLTSFVKGVATLGKQELEASLQRMWEAESIGRNTPGIEGKLAQAETHLVASLIQILQESYVKAAWNLRKSKKFYDEAAVLLLDYRGQAADVADLNSGVQFGVGMFNLFLSILPPSVGLVAGVLGFDSDRAHGLELLMQSQAGGCLYSPLSALVLLSFYVSISLHIGSQTPADLDEAARILDWAHARIPNSFFFQWFSSRLLRSRAMIHQSLDCLDRSMVSTANIAAFRQLVNYERGWCYFILLEYATAAATLGTILSEDGITRQSNIRGFYAYHIALCQACTGKDKQVAMASLESVPALISGRKRGIDTYVLRKAAGMIDVLTARSVEFARYCALLEAFEMMLVWNAFPSMPPDVALQALDLLNTARALCWYEWTVGDCIRWHSYRAYILSSNGSDQAAEAEFQIIFGEQRQLDKRAVADGVFALAWYVYALWKTRTAAVRRDLDVAITAHDNASAVGGYDVQKLMSFRLFSLRNTILARQNLMVE